MDLNRQRLIPGCAHCLSRLLCRPPQQRFLKSASRQRAMYAITGITQPVSVMTLHPVARHQREGVVIILSGSHTRIVIVPLTENQQAAFFTEGGG